MYNIKIVQDKAVWGDLRTRYYCPDCNNQIHSNYYKFCPGCGLELLWPICDKCKTRFYPINDGKFCFMCGTKFPEVDIEILEKPEKISLISKIKSVLKINKAEEELQDQGDIDIFDENDGDIGLSTSFYIDKEPREIDIFVIEGSDERIKPLDIKLRVISSDDSIKENIGYLNQMAGEKLYRYLRGEAPVSVYLGISSKFDVMRKAWIADSHKKDTSLEKFSEGEK